jgi:1A family penicillin-binding protein
MSSILVKIFATALTLGQVTVQPEAVKTTFDPVQDRARVEQILKDGCTHMRRAFDIEDINLDELIATAMEDPQAVAGDVKVLQGISFGDLHQSYRVFCKGEAAQAPVDLGEVINYYNKAVADLPDHTKLKGMRLPGTSTVLDYEGRRFTEVFEADHRRVWVPIGEIPDAVQKAFIAAEDKRFHQHRGIDERGVIRAFMGNLTDPGRPQGGSTITQQVVKNLLVGDDVTYERKMREMIVAARVEQVLSKPEILELYLNAIYLGRSSWGIETAAQTYFGKPAKALNALEGALLAGLAKGPNFYNPDRHPERARERLAYVLTRMREDGVITEAQVKQGLETLPKLVAHERARRTSGFHFVDHLSRDAKAVAGIEGLTASSYTLRSTIHPALQEAAETALQDGLARYELSVGRQRFEGPEANIARAVEALEKQVPKPEGKPAASAEKTAAAPAERTVAASAQRPAASAEKTAAQAPAEKPAWQRALEAAYLPLYDVHWPVGVVLQAGRDKKTGTDIVRVGLKDGRILPLNANSARRGLKLYDVVHVRVVEAKGKAARAELRTRPTVQGAAVVLENKTGRILAMSGGFSYPLSQLNRATQAQRQPGSALKPITYLAALAKGLQPNTVVWDTPVTLPPMGGGSRARDFWTPKNYDGGSAGLMTLRRALENSKNLVTARLLDGAIDGNPERSLNQVCDLALEAQLYADCERYYPFVLGAQPVRVLDLAAFYATIANEGARPTPYAIESVEEQSGRVVYRRKPSAPVALGSADRVAFYQMKTILQGVLERGTARPIRHLAPFVAGKTGTSDNENDAWFVGFTNDVTVAVWVGYDNAGGRRTLGRGQTGGKVALPIFEQIVQAAWAHHAPKTALAPPSPEAQRQMMALKIDLNTGDRMVSGQGGFTEYFRLDRSGKLAETQYDLVPREEAWAFRNPDPWSDGEASGPWGYEDERGPYAQAPQPQYRDPRYADPRYADPRYSDPRYADPRYAEPRYVEPRRNAPAQRPWWEEAERPRQRRVDPDYFWGRSPVY